MLNRLINGCHFGGVHGVIERHGVVYSPVPPGSLQKHRPADADAHLCAAVGIGHIRCMFSYRCVRQLAADASTDKRTNSGFTWRRVLPFQLGCAISIVTLAFSTGSDIND